MKFSESEADGMNGHWYFLTDLALCGLAAAVIGWAWPRLDSLWRGSACLTAGIVMVLQVVNEYLGLIVFKAWSVSSDPHAWLGWFPGGIPVEEYLFWFAFAWLIPFAYSGLAVRFAAGTAKGAGRA
jgi:hypothetical protein